MEFSNSILLWTSIAAIIPVIIHLLNKEKPKPVSIPTVKFILKAVQKSAGKRKINSLLLLITRILILLILSLLVSKPFLKYDENDQSAEKHIALIIDNSFYTSHLSSEGSQFSTIKTAALKIIKQLPTGCHISVLTIEEDSQFTRIKEYVENKISNLSISNQYIDIHAKISRAKAILESQESKGEIYVFSDMNKGAWSGNYQLQQSDQHEITVIPISQRKGNIFINKVFLQNNKRQDINKVYVNRSINFVVSLDGDRNLKGTTATLTIDDQAIDEYVILENNNSTSFNFPYSFAKEGTYRCKITVHSDDCIITDNEYFLTFKVSPPEEITIIHSGNKPALYLNAALSPSGWHGRQRYNTTLLLEQDITKQSLNNTGLAILSGSISLAEDQWFEINRFVENGGRLIISPDKSTNLKQLSQRIFLYFHADLKLNKQNLQILKSKDSNYDFLSPSLSKKLKTINTYQSFTLSGDLDHKGFHSLLKYSDGSACLAKSIQTNSQVYFFGICPTSEFSNLLSTNTYAVLWHSIVESLIPNEANQTNFICDSPIELPATNEETQNYEVYSPTGTIDQIPQSSFAPSNNLFVSNYSQTPIPGHYSCNSVIFKGFSCNLKRSPEHSKYPEESELSFLNHFTKKDLYKNSNSSLLSRDSPLQILFLMAFGLFMIEVHLANRRHYV